MSLPPLLVELEVYWIGILREAVDVKITNMIIAIYKTTSNENSIIPVNNSEPPAADDTNWAKEL